MVSRLGRLALEQLVVDVGAVGGLVLDHDDAKVVDVYAEVHVGQLARLVQREPDVAPARIAPEREALERVLDRGRQPKYDCIVACYRLGPDGRARGQDVEPRRIVLERVVDVGVRADDVGPALLSDSPDIMGRRGRDWVQNADYVGNVVVREARVLLSNPAWVEDILRG